MIESILAAHADLEQPGTTFRAIDAALASEPGHILFTVLVHHPGTGESERFYSSQPAAYPVGGRKPFNTTFWAKRVLIEHRPYIGRSAADIAAVFNDHALIASLGCDSVINLPVVHDGRLLGTINLLNEAAWFDDSDIPLGLLFGARAIPGYRAVSE